ncbi:hypothetical protein CONPUDRAFT_72022 [Coniophora puteana RWD-64-598 SS2]|uniref:Uncharacterized protein n=1 Tax=Coniophora puteana (strain RWD-64-598) TaxID=741705 RepID=A0A5M3MWI4_CONPW|nr:uncharacterized protein CONPUDRAFT_72022 [Coniophora puteana RWD-64-598 SS2]EIW83476.1 hypothetical protein CONPUDRAFT_72022 [Coniophora puteana RWD-64-598 SS2]
MLDISTGNLVTIVCKGGEVLASQTFNGQMKAIERRMNTSRTLIKELPKSSYDPNVISPDELQRLKAKFRRMEGDYHDMVDLRDKWFASHFDVKAIYKVHQIAADAKSLKRALMGVSERAFNHDSLHDFEEHIDRASLEIKVSDARAQPPGGSEGNQTSAASTSAIIMATERESKCQVPLRVDISQAARSESAEGIPARCAIFGTPTSEPTDPEYIKARQEFLDKAADMLIDIVTLGHPSLYVDADIVKAALYEAVRGKTVASG